MKIRISLFASGIVILLLACSKPTANSQSFVRAVERTKPAVVSIRTYNAYGEFAMKLNREGGSGVIIDKEKGYILTNYHVINDKKTNEISGEIFAILPNRSPLKATVVGYDRLSDLAVLQVNPPEDKPLLEIEWGNSDRVQIGEWAIAIGYPYLFLMEGRHQDAIHWRTVDTDDYLYDITIELLEPTISVGIVSATDKIRLSKEHLHTNLIQTDASLNPGNSGGALVNREGQLIGINTFITTESGGSDGVGFAISANEAKKICDQLITSGYVTPSYFGLETQSVTQKLIEAKKLELPSTISGVYVSNVDPQSPAYTAGLKPGDVIRNLSGLPIKNELHLKAITRLLPPNKKVLCEFMRDRTFQKVTLIPTFIGGSESSGLMVRQLDRKMSENYIHHGVIITDIAPGSIFEEKGLRRDDLIYQINHKKIHTLEDYNAFQDMLPMGTPVKIQMYIERDGWYKTITVHWTR